MTFTVNASLLDAIVLSVVSTEDTYGYKITQEVNKIIGVSESTLYPVLRRLQKDSNLEVYDMEYLGRNRRYYKITNKGKVLLNLYQEEWTLYKEKIDRVFNKDFTPFNEAARDSELGKKTADSSESPDSSTEKKTKCPPDKMTAEEKIAHLKFGERIDNLKIPEKISNLKLGEKIESLKIPEKIDSLKIPEKIESLKIGEKFDSLKIPEKINNLKIPEKIEDIGEKVEHFLHNDRKSGTKDTKDNAKNNKSENNNKNEK